MNQLSTDAGYSSAHLVDIPANTILKNRIAIREMEVDDLFYLEKDLAFGEKVIVVFILHFGNDQSAAA